MDYIWIVCSCFTRILYGDLHIGYLEYNLTVTVNRCTSTYITLLINLLCTNYNLFIYLISVLIILWNISKKFQNIRRHTYVCAYDDFIHVHCCANATDVVFDRSMVYMSVGNKYVEYYTIFIVKNIWFLFWKTQYVRIFAKNSSHTVFFWQY